jgi:hypothetical protein
MRALMAANGVRRDSVLVGVATQPPVQTNAAALADRLHTQLYAEPALVPASPWLSRTRPARPTVSLRADSATTDMIVRLTPGDTRRVAWWTVRVLSEGAWRTWILPGAQRRLTIPAASSSPVTRVLVTAVDRYGTESVVVERPAR